MLFFNEIMKKVGVLCARYNQRSKEVIKMKDIKHTITLKDAFKEQMKQEIKNEIKTEYIDLIKQEIKDELEESRLDRRGKIVKYIYGVFMLFVLGYILGTAVHLS